MGPCAGGRHRVGSVWRCARDIKELSIRSKLAPMAVCWPTLVPARFRPQTGAVRDYDLTVGPTVSWMVTPTIQLQALVGLAQPKKTNLTTGVGVVYASIDF